MNEDLMRFDEACACLSESGPAVAQTHIAAVLKTIAASPSVYGVVRRCARGFDFESEFNRSKAPVGMSDYRLIPPAQITDFVAYAFGLLLHIDLGNVDLATLLSTYYRDADVNASFRRFALEIVDKFRRAVDSLTDDRGTETREDGIAASPDLDGDGVTEVTDVLTDCVNRVSALDLGLRQKEELLVECDGLARALRSGDRALTYVVYVGFKYALSTVPELSVHVETVGNLLNRYRLL